MMARICSVGSYGLGSIGFAFLAFGLLMGAQKSAIANANPAPIPLTGDCKTTLYTCGPGNCTTAAVDCVDPVNGPCSCS